MKNRSITLITIRKVALGIFPLIIGGLIYITYRVDTLIMFRWFEKIGLLNLIDTIRSNQQLQSLIIPSWVKYSLPDALWLFSLNYTLFTLWNFKINKQSAFWMISASTIGVFWEIGQLFGIVNGTFDIIDLFFLVIASLILFFPITNFKNLKIT